jgi:hypothetical protein
MDRTVGIEEEGLGFRIVIHFSGEKISEVLKEEIFMPIHLMPVLITNQGTEFLSSKRY